ncbi:urease accessory protein UreF [Kineosporia sp. NBRC 101677]|uniref:urease accessory protein UreF n=1 Tax=Kineosporia sp. NBRC 101677 TaxID=3032197 RepID=UPI0024A4B6EE|nr:urease accessory UreF family protein [Kineosporia sp. NBRC 101677]GLY14489.1 urease accessory protein UreF [Kineosporia sp. NBRC 101677]
MFAPGIASLLALADQRLPSGGHVHSGGIEQAITEGLVTGVVSLERFLERRLRTTGLVTAGLAAAATVLSHSPDAPAQLARLDAEADARTPSPAQRLAARAQGRGLLRTARAAWAAPSTTLSWSDLGARPHHPIVLGCACAAGGVSAEGAALAAAYLSVSAPSTAAQRLLALDPVSVAAVTVRLGPAIEQIAAAALLGWPATTPVDRPSHPEAPPLPTCGETNVLSIDFDLLPDDSDPLLDLLAERHAAREERLFAS